jgi:hypothetical protein
MLRQPTSFLKRLRQQPGPGSGRCSAASRAPPAGSWVISGYAGSLPFSTPVSEIPAIVRSLPDAQRTPPLLEDMVGALGNSPYDEAEGVLFKLAEDDRRLYLDYKWRSTVLELGTVTAARRLVDLTASGALSGRSVNNDFHWRSALGDLISRTPDIRAHVYELLKRDLPLEHVAPLASAVGQFRPVRPRFASLRVRGGPAAAAPEVLV